jgi:phosphopantothenate-cysteine ligase
MNILITAGGTTEKIDQVRKISNISTGALGRLIYQQLDGYSESITKVFYIYAKGAVLPSINLITNTEFIEIESVADLENAIRQVMGSNTIDYFIHSMAVSDYTVDWVSNSKMIGDLIEDFQCRGITTPECILRTINDYPVYQNNVYNKNSKISSDSDDLILRLKPTTKVISIIKKLQPHAFLVGFKLLNGASDAELFDVGFKLLRKNRCNLVVANDLAKIRQGTHEALVIYPEKEFDKFSGKEAVAKNLIDIMFKRGSVAHPKSINVGNEILSLEQFRTQIESMKKTGKQLFDSGLLPTVESGTYGNMSIMTNNGMLITGRNVNKGNLSDNDIVYVEKCVDSSEENVYSNVHYHGTVKPSIDTAIHWELYKKTGKKAIVHVHTKKMYSNFPITGDNYPCGSDEELKAIIEVWEANPQDIIQLYKHGLIILGDTLEDCLSKLNTVNNKLSIEKMENEHLTGDVWELWREWLKHLNDIEVKQHENPEFWLTDMFYLIKKENIPVALLILKVENNEFNFSVYTKEVYQGKGLDVGKNVIKLLTNLAKSRNDIDSLVLNTKDACGVIRYYSLFGFEKQDQQDSDQIRMVKKLR